MSKSYWLFILSFIIWIPLGYIVFHRFDLEQVSPHPSTSTGNQVSLPTPNKVNRTQNQNPIRTDINNPINNDKLHHNINRYDKSATATLYSVDVHNRSAADFKAKRGGVAWSEFIKLPKASIMKEATFSVPSDLNLIQCSSEVEEALKKPGLSEQDYRWCEWALSPSGGAVKVGKSYGKLQSQDRQKFENLNCNNVATGKNPSCDDAWGDGFVRNWRANIAPEVCGDGSVYSSKVQCMDSSSTARFCIFENAVMDFSLMTDVPRPQRSTGSRKWEPGFLSTHCEQARSNINYFEFYKPAVDPARLRCDYVVNETVLAYSHDDIRNLGHTMSDFMNVWLVLWLSQHGPHAKNIHFLNIDALRQGHNYHDALSQFGRHYELSFASVLRANDFARQGRPKVCFKHLIMQPRPVVLFTWDGWWNDVQCTFLGPSSMFQRWNLQVRRNYGLLHPQYLGTNERVQVLLLLRKARGGGGSQQQSRVFHNPEELQTALQASVHPSVTVVAVDLSTLSFEEQVRLVGNSSVLVGMHGAGIPASMHMAVGTKYCCGVVEIFPEGEFKSIRGYGNMARRMGHHYERVDLDSSAHRSASTYVKPEKVVKQMKAVLQRIEAKSSCILPSVLNDPFME